jgi:hypothetical protein
MGVSLKTCACCGQNVKLEGRPVVEVSDALLALCNEAYAAAEARAGAEVLVADLAWCVARSAHWPRDAHETGLSPGQLARAAENALARAGRAARGGPPRTSDDLKSLLLRAGKRAADAGRIAADVSDLLFVLVSQSSDLAGADFVRGEGFATRPGAFRSASETTGTYQHQSTHTRYAFASPTALSPTSQYEAEARLKAITGRLDGQERANAELRLKLDALSERVQTQMQAQIQAMSGRLAHVVDRAQALERDRGQMEARIDARLTTRLSERGGADPAPRAELVQLVRRMEMQDRQIGELRALVETLSQQAMTATARLTQAVDLSRAQAEMLAGLERRVASSRSRSSGREGRRTGSGSARSRRRRSRQLSLRLRLRLRFRQRRRARLRTLKRGGWRRSSRQWTRQSSPQAKAAEAHSPATHAAPRITFREPHNDRFDAVPRPYVESLPPLLLREAVALPELEDEIEPLEDDDDADGDGTAGDRPKRFYLALDDVVERAPSIGPRTAARLTAAGVSTVRDLLACNPQAVASRVQSRYVSAERLAAWKCQSRLVCTVPWLRGTHAQLLVGAGYDTLDKLQQARTADVCTGILRFATTREGQSVLRSGSPPAPERVAKWMGNVTLAEPERARLVA